MQVKIDTGTTKIQGQVKSISELKHERGIAHYILDIEVAIQKKDITLFKGVR